MTPENIYQCLVRRGVDLNPRLTSDSPSGSFDLSKEMLDIHRLFDGFTVMDNDSLIQMWSVSMIGSSAGYTIEDGFENGYRAIGDYLIGSDLIIADVSDASRPLYFAEKRRIISDNYMDFWINFIGGKYDTQ